MVGLLVLVGCTDGSADPDSPGTTVATAPEPSEPPVITFGIYGPPDELAAWRQVIQAYNAAPGSARAKLITWPDRETALGQIAGDSLPDVFLSSYRDLDDLVATKQIQPVGELLDEREVDFGDGFERTALRAFGRNNALQCMPYGVSPRVLFYNTKLIDFDKMLKRRLVIPEFQEDRPRSWNFEQFTAAAEFAARPARNIRGFYFEPSLDGLAPMFYAAGAPVFDDEEPPTSTRLSSDEAVAGLDVLLPVLRKTQLNLSPEQLAKADPIEWFTRGKLGMIAGDHTLVPLLRRTTGLSWDVMPIPVIDSGATTGDVTGLCMSADAPAAEAADLIVNAISADSVSTVAAAGYLVPTNLEVSESQRFLGQGAPISARVFNDSIRQLELAPSLYITPELETAVSSGILGLLNATYPDPRALAEQIDAASQAVLEPPDPDPDSDPDSDGASPSSSPSPWRSTSPSGSP
jgi:multiple sugar transport system substrate-binding protein